MWHSLPDFGHALVMAILVACAYTFALAVSANSRRPRLLAAARHAAFGTIALITVAVIALAYAFITHDFRIRYVARYSDRSLPTAFLLSGLWGGQDGSVLWWLMLLGAYVAACLHWLKNRYLALQPYIIATFMAVIAFFTVLMLFAANPFATSLGPTRLDGDGLNPLLQNFYMAVHPPSLYLGFVGCTVPFAFAIAALITNRLDNEWIVAVRKWMLFAWLFLSIGNGLGMLWAYVELGWGGYWAWDPVENASLLPWLTATAYIHSTMIQERRGMLKVWNLFLICLTFFLTIFGTFLTRSGAIASVHAFAQSNIGQYFIVFLGIIAASCIGLIVWRLPSLRSEARIESLASREAAFLANNWALLGATLFVLVATTFPLISRTLLSEAVTMPAPFYNRWMAPTGLVIFFLMGFAPLLGWRQTSSQAIARGFVFPTASAAMIAIAIVIFGPRFGMPPFVASDPIVAGSLGVALQKIASSAPLITASLAAFNAAVVIQEFARGVQARRSSKHENYLTALVQLVAKARRRYGGYVVHFGITLMFVGFLGRAWGSSHEANLSPGQSFTIDSYVVRYAAPRVESDHSKRMLFVDLDISSASGKALGRLSPARFFYRKNPEQPTTEVAVRHSLVGDLYLVVGDVNPQAGSAAVRAHVNPLVSWIWIGIALLIIGSSISLWPELPEQRVGVRPYARMAGVALIGVLLAVLLTSLPLANASSGPSPVSGVKP